MRSRFAAFARGEVAYLWRTLHADHDDRARPRAVVEAELARACRSARYDRLRVIDAAHDASSGQVLFHAAVRVDGRDQSFVELSDFLHDGTGWRYLCGVSRPAPAGSPAARVGSIDAYWALVRER
ncbi:MAG: hypothetical protein IT379_15945 [Deltaproteobacteria bacterium]|nr:hypothetical protein [Deltaproteobacteria bacterium]